MRSIVRLAAWVIVAASLSAAAAAEPSAPAGMTLERVAIVARHGVRPPTKSPEQLAQYAAEPWPAWPVAPGELTPHGRKAAQLLAAYLRGRYAGLGLWPAQGCPPAPLAYVWADGQDQRTRESGQAWLDGLFPGCALTAAHGPADQPDPVFDNGFGGLTREAAERAILARAPNGDLDHLGPDYDHALAALAAVLTPVPGPKTLGAAPNRLGWGEEGPKLSGPLATGSTLAENIMLEYAEGMPAAEVGWGRVKGVEGVATLLPLHSLYSELTRRTPALARPRAALLSRAVADYLQGASVPPKPGSPAPDGARFFALLGHDTNLANLSGVLDVDWTLPGQPDKTPPDGALVFELWRDAAGNALVRLAMIYQTLEQLHALTPLDAQTPPGIVTLDPHCAHATAAFCPLQELTERLTAAP